MRFIVRVACSCALLGAGPLHAQDQDDAQGPPEPEISAETSGNWLDGLHEGLYSMADLSSASLMTGCTSR